MGHDTDTLEPFLVPFIGVAEDVRAIAEPVVVDEGCELVFFQLVRGPRRTKVRFFIDTLGSHGEKDDAHVGIADLERVNRRLSDVLDVEDQHRGLFKGAWDLEVSSPGVDRPLAKRSHFQHAVDKKVQVKLQRAQAGKRTHTARLTAAGDDAIELLLDGDESLTVSFDNIESAHVVFEFEPAGKKKKASEKRGKKAANPKSTSKARAR